MKKYNTIHVYLKESTVVSNNNRNNKRNILFIIYIYIYNYELNIKRPTRDLFFCLKTCITGRTIKKKKKKYIKINKIISVNKAFEFFG